MKRILMITAMALGLTTAMSIPNTAEAARWRGGYRAYPGYYGGGYYRGYRPYRGSYYRGYRPYRGYYHRGWGPRGYVSTPWFGVGW